MILTRPTTIRTQIYRPILLASEVAEVSPRTTTPRPPQNECLACDQCRKTKSKCDRLNGDGGICKSCALTGTGWSLNYHSHKCVTNPRSEACTFLGRADIPLVPFHDYPDQRT